MSPDAPMSAAAKMAHARAGRQPIDKAKDFQVGRARVAALPPVSVLRYSAEELAEGALCSVSEAATILQISQQGVRALIDRGQLASYRDDRGRRVVVTSDLADTQAGRRQAAQIAQVEEARHWAAYYADPRNLTSDMTAADQAALVAPWESRVAEAELMAKWEFEDR